jgi:hypothetical protein
MAKNTDCYHDVDLNIFEKKSIKKNYCEHLTFCIENSTFVTSVLTLILKKNSLHFLTYTNLIKRIKLILEFNNLIKNQQILLNKMK